MDVTQLKIENGIKLLDPFFTSFILHSFLLEKNTLFKLKNNNNMDITRLKIENGTN